jgi:hypothetical protein
MQTNIFKVENKLKELLAIELASNLDDLNKQKMICEFYKSTIEKTQFDHELFILKANSLHDKIIDGIKKQKSLEIQFDALNAHWLQLKKGKIVVTLFIFHLMCYANDVCNKVLDSITKNCLVCGFNFPFKNIIICSCRHFYHAWCVIIWFKMNTQCNLCGGLVHPNWCKSFVFAKFDNKLKSKHVDLECELTRYMTLQQRRATTSSHLPTVD